MPPVVSKTTMTGKGPNPQSIKKSVISNDDDIWNLSDVLNVIVYGKPGTGKTQFASTFPGPILYIVVSGMNSAGELKTINTPELRKKIKPKLPKSMDEVVQIIRDAKGVGYNTVVLDNLTGFVDMSLCSVLGLEKAPTQKSWGFAKQQDYAAAYLMVKNTLRDLIELGSNTVLIAHEKTVGEENTSELIDPTILPSASASISTYLNQAFDNIVQTYTRAQKVQKVSKVGGKEVITEHKTGRIEYCLRIAPHELFLTKFRIPITSTESLPDSIVNPTYEKIQEIINVNE